MSARFEIRRTDAEQPWHAVLLVSGRVILTSENYSRMVAAERAVLSAAKAFGYKDPRLTTNVPGKYGHAIPVEKILTAANPSLPWLSVAYRDEREVTS